jgi:hypothetical protein
MSFYGLVLILTALIVSFYLLTFLYEINSVASISAAYMTSAGAILKLANLAPTT